MSGVNGCQGRTDVRECHGGRSSIARNSAERLVASAIWSWEDPPFSGTSSTSSQPSFHIYYECDSMLILKGWCSSFVPL